MCSRQNAHAFAGLKRHSSFVDVWLTDTKEGFVLGIPDSVADCFHCVFHDAMLRMHAVNIQICKCFYIFSGSILTLNFELQ